MPSYQTTELSQLTAGLYDAELSAVVRRLTGLLRDADYLRYPNHHASPNVPHDVIDVVTMASVRQVATELLQLCQQFIDRQQ